MKKFLLYFVFVLNLAVIFYLWFNGSSNYLSATGINGGRFIAFGRLAGLLAEFFILLQLILIGRITFIEQLFGHDHLNQIHRWVGYGLVIFLLSHPLLLTLGYSQLSEVSFTSQFLNFIKNWEDVFKALLAVVLFFGVIISSIVIVKKRLHYETWHFTHLLMYGAIALAFGHQTNTGDLTNGKALYYWTILNFSVFGLILLYRWLAPFYRFYLHRFYIEKIVKESPGIFSIYLKGKNLSAYKFFSGQFANLTFMQSGMWFTHPFSFSASPNENFLRFSIKTAGNFTDKINGLKINTKVIIDGPLGIFTLNKATKNKFLLLAGGIGITPIRALAETLVKTNKDMVLLYGNRTASDIIFQNEFQVLQINPHLTLSQEINGNYEKGYIDKDKILRLVPDFLEREIYLCGPNRMMQSVLKDLAQLNIPKNQIHYEKFNY